jgi:hypothetical protein
MAEERMAKVLDALLRKSAQRRNKRAKPDSSLAQPELPGLSRE